MALGDVQEQLATIGVSPETFWRAYDQCNCGRFFTKETLHYFHGPQCTQWPYVDTPSDISTFTL